MTIINPISSISTQSESKTPSANTLSAPTTKLGFLSFIKAKFTAFAISLGLAASPQLTENLALAERANSYTDRTILFSSTNPLRNKIKGPALSTLQHSIDLMRESYIFNSSPFQYAKDIGLRSLKLNQGECLEMSCAGLVYFLYQKNLQAKVDVYEIKNKNPQEPGGDHAFLVIGRDKHSDPSNPSTWGENAVVADPLRNIAFPATQIETLEDHLGLDHQNNPVSSPFNPRKQTLSLWISNAFTASDLAYLSGNKLTSAEKRELKILQSHLQAFHNAAAEEEKREAAERILNVVGDVQLEMKKLLLEKNRSDQPFLMAKLSLYDQMGHYLRESL
jgi:hypothetical protein